jgi:hypothetical protein
MDGASSILKWIPSSLQPAQICPVSVIGSSGLMVARTMMPQRPSASRQM